MFLSIYRYTYIHIIIKRYLINSKYIYNTAMISSVQGSAITDRRALSQLPLSPKDQPILVALTKPPIHSLLPTMYIQVKFGYTVYH